MLTQLTRTSTRSLFSKAKNSTSKPKSYKFNGASAVANFGGISFAVYYYFAFWRQNVAKEYEDATGHHDHRSLWEIVSGKH